MDNGKGKGAAIKLAINSIKSDVLVFIDADGSHRAEEMTHLIKPLIERRADMVIASRILEGSDELHGNLLNLIRCMGNHISNWIINLIWAPKGTSITDCQNGYRAIRTDVARQLDLKEDGFAVEQEMVIKCLKKGFRISEIPSYELKRKSGESHIRLIRGLYEYAKCFVKAL